MGHLRFAMARILWHSRLRVLKNNSGSNNSLSRYGDLSSPVDSWRLVSYQ